MIEVFGGRVRQARILRVIQAGTLADEMGWHGSRVSRVESRARFEVPTRELERLSTVLNFPTRFFMAEPAAEVAEHDLLFRGLASMTKRERVYLAESFNAAADVLDVAQRAQRFPPVRYVQFFPNQTVL